MKPANLMYAAALALACAVGGISGATADSQVVAQDLRNIRGSGKVMGAQWTVRKDRYTLQLVLPMPQPLQNLAGPVVVTPPGTSPEPARVRVWVLKADGTQIYQLHGTGKPKPEGLSGGSRNTSYSLTYAYPLETGKDAVAVAIQINDDYFIDPLQPMR
jgi:hypothetical protein